MPKKKILIYNPISGRGHFDSWALLFSNILVKLDIEVAALTPDSTVFQHEIFKPNRAKILTLRWDNSPHRPFAYRISRRLHRQFKPLLGEDPVLMARRIRTACAEADFNPDLIFNMYLDAYGDDHYQWKQFSKYCSIPLSGIQMAPKSDGAKGLYNLKQLRGVFFLDEKFATAYSLEFPNIIAKFLPDITQTYVKQNSSLAKNVLHRARGRNIVFMGGAINRQKNLPVWRDLIKRADPSRWFFVQVGEWIKNLLDPQDTEALYELTNENRENLFLHGKFVKDEGEMNALIQLSDIIFAVYKDFPHSSNMPTKAAHFSKPILVSNRYVMADRVARHCTGMSVKEDDVFAILDGLEYLAKNKFPEENFLAFRAETSEHHVLHVIDDFLSETLSTKESSRHPH